MAGFFLVRQARGPEWDTSRSRRDQPGFDEHAAFIDWLTEEGKIAIGGPVGDVDGEHTVLVVQADTETDARELFSADPWRDSILQIEVVERWTLWIGRERLVDEDLDAA